MYNLKEINWKPSLNVTIEEQIILDYTRKI